MHSGEILREMAGLPSKLTSSLWGVLPIYPVYAERIYGKTKLFEYRKNKPAKDISVLVLYETSPVSQLTGLFTISTILTDSPNELWSQTKEYSGINKSDFDNYFKNSKVAFAYVIRDVKRFESSISLGRIGISTPQALRYI